ncbi:MAG: type I restriction endonuclease subunit M [Gemmatimonadaceae bacterium]|nr:type I restriction endonuclease subunit M [Gemmatimonadaceae bacterium]
MSVARVLEYYDRVADAPDAVGKLRRFVLDLAVRGKLVEQDDADESANSLISRIASERKRRVGADELRKSVRHPRGPGSDGTFKLPRGWSWKLPR